MKTLGGNLRRITLRIDEMPTELSNIHVEANLLTPGSQPIFVEEQSPKTIRPFKFDSEDNNIYSLNFHFSF